MLLNLCEFRDISLFTEINFTNIAGTDSQFCFHEMSVTVQFAKFSNSKFSRCVVYRVIFAKEYRNMYTE